jgi:hypothetical protein
VSQTFSKKQGNIQEASRGLTPMQAAFLAGLLDLAQRETGAESIVLPTGHVEPGEIRQAIVALVRAKVERGDAE